MCESIEKAAVFNDKVINLSTIKLSTCDIECLCLFLTSSSHKQWVKVHLYGCYIQDRGLHIIHKYINESGITITELRLSINGLTQISSSFISNIVLSCKVETVVINGNPTIGDNEELYTMLSHPSSVVDLLAMDNVALSSTSCRALFAAVKDSTKLKILTINHNNITDDVADDIANALAVNKSLHTLDMYNPISGESMQLILQALRANKILDALTLPSCPPAIKEKLVSLKDEINDMRTKQRITQHLKVRFI
ncbi:nucleotide-binding oligomerization domain-containing protein 1-like [Dysidea avara]|uniref:nucleotide-binding oligomerization domain-containing protein 1-like n=1 Tax=Dysidea avara TaxID=196820 RepID=UPI0033309FA5